MAGISPSLIEVEIVTADGEAVAAAQSMLLDVWNAVDGDTIDAAEVEDSEMPVLVEDFRVKAGDPFILNDDVIAALSPYIDFGFLDMVDFLSGLRQANG